MTDTNGRLICIACGQPIEGDHISSDLCNLCYRQMGKDLEEMDSDSTGFK